MPLENHLQYAKTSLLLAWGYLCEHTLIISVIAGVVLACMVVLGMFRTHLSRWGHAVVRRAALAAQSAPSAIITEQDEERFIGPPTRKEKIRRLLVRVEAERSRTQGGYILTEMAFKDDKDAAKRGVMVLDPYSPRAHELAEKTTHILTATLPKAEGRITLAALGEFVAETQPVGEIRHKPEPLTPPVELELRFWYCLFARRPRWTDFDYRFAVLAFLLNVLELLEYHRAVALKELFDDEQKKRQQLEEQALAELLAQNAALGIRPEETRPLTMLEKLELERRQAGLSPQAPAVRFRSWKPPPPLEEKWPWLKWLIPSPVQERRQLNSDIN